MSFNYHIYGLKIRSSRQIKVLDEKIESDIDLFVSWTENIIDTPEQHLTWEQIITHDLKGRTRIQFFKAPSPTGEFYYKIFFNTDSGGISSILNPEKTQLWIIYHHKEPSSNLDSYFVGVFLGCVLRLKGILCLHASVVNLNNKAILLLGKKKSGKSTTAAAFAKLGYKVLSDDIAVVKRKDNMFFIESGYPKVRLRPKSLAIIHPGKYNDEFVSVHSHKDSRYSDIKNSFQESGLPLGAIYVLGETVNDNDKPFVESMTAEKLIMLHQNTFAPFVITSELRKKEFEDLSQIALQVPIRNLRFGRNVEMVNQQCLTIIEDFLYIKN